MSPYLRKVKTASGATAVQVVSRRKVCAGSLRFSHQMPLWRVRMTRAAAAIVVMALGSRVTCLRALKCLIRALALSAGALIELISSLRHLVSGSGCGFLAGTLMPMPALV